MTATSRAKPVSSAVLTRNMGTNTALTRARSSGRFQRVLVARYRERVGAPVRPVGRPPAVTPELGALGEAMLRQGSTIEEITSHLGVAKSSWYRYVRRVASPPRRAQRRRRANAISANLERQMVRLDESGLPRVTIAERLGLHINTVVKYLLRAGRPRRHH